MSSTVAIARTTLIQIIGKALAVLLGVATISIIMRYLGQTGFGYFTTALAFMTMAATMADLGLSVVALRELSANPEQEQKTFNNVFTLRLFSSLLVLILACLLILFFPYQPIVKLAALIVSFSFLFNSLVQVLTTLFQKYLRMGMVVVAENLGRIITLIWTLAIIQTNGNLLWIITGSVINSAIFCLILFLASHKFVHFAFSFDPAVWTKIWHKTWPLALTIVFNMVYFRADTIILSIYWPANYVGLYGAPYRILELLATFPHMFLGLVVPLLTTAWLTDRAKFLSHTQKVWDFFLLITLPLIILGQVLSVPIMLLLGGSTFLASAPILRILVWPTAFIFLSALFNYLVVITEQQKKMIAWYATSAVLAFGSYLIFIPRFHYWAAALITLFIELLMLIGTMRIYHQTAGHLPNFKNGRNYLLASVMSAMLVLPFLSQPYAALIIAPLAYTAILLLFNWMDWNLIKNILTKKS
ncbi:MAG: flippase [Candidatus Komeilibacteria bacterium]|nr:flippase [Candidatus Komeilibacteria bacterium]